MDFATYRLDTLFAQLGLPNSREEIEAFLDIYSPLPDDVALCDAPFWKPTQAEFLLQAIKDDAGWALVVDNLNVRLRH